MIEDELNIETSGCINNHKLVLHTGKIYENDIVTDKLKNVRKIVNYFNDSSELKLLKSYFYLNQFTKVKLHTRLTERPDGGQQLKC